ncbi:MAG TPA: hypothetical protein VGH79_02715 [Gaiellaceae bacterium]|jgi:hypothetical protein
MSKLGKWPLSIVIAASLVVLVLLVTGWRSATKTVQSVIVANSATHPAQVHVTYKTSQIASGATVVPAGNLATLIPLTDVSLYRDVTLYLYALDGKNSIVEQCFVQTQDSHAQVYNLDEFATGGIGTLAVKSYDPAPPNIKVSCNNTNTSDVTVHWELAGRNN